MSHSPVQSHTAPACIIVWPEHQGSCVLGSSHFVPYCKRSKLGGPITVPGSSMEMSHSPVQSHTAPACIIVWPEHQGSCVLGSSHFVPYCKRSKLGGPITVPGSSMEMSHSPVQSHTAPACIIVWPEHQGSCVLGSSHFVPYCKRSKLGGPITVLGSSMEMSHSPVLRTLMPGKLLGASIIYQAEELQL